MFVKRRQAGDTIVEVLIGIAIISSVLGGAYALATRSLKGARISQERTEALKLAEGQVERLKCYARQDACGDYTQFDTIFRTTTTLFCFNLNSPNHERVPDPDNNPDACKSGFYRASIGYSDVDDPPPNFGTFSVTITWDSLALSGTETLTINYQP